MFPNIGLYSYGAALIVYALLTAIVIFSRGSRRPSLAVLLACVATATWAGVTVFSSVAPYPHVKLMQLAEFVRDAAWIFLLLKVLGGRLQGSGHILSGTGWMPWFGIVALIIVAALFAPELSAGLLLPQGLPQSMVFTIWLALSILALLLLEQIYRNSSEAERWSVKHLCLGLGVIFAYDFFMYAEALLFQKLDPNLWQARGIASTFAAIFIAVATGRMDRSEDSRSLHVSRHVVFHSVTLLAAGLYLIMMALVGYFIRYLGGTWGGVLQITFLCAAGLLLLALLFSGQVRARTRVWLSKNFFSYKYDYRIEWLQFTQTLATGAGGGNIPETIIRAIAHLAQSPAGVLWNRTEGSRFVLSTCWETGAPDNAGNLGNLPAWLQQSEWIIDLEEWRRSPDLYGELQIPAGIAERPRAWLIIPLMFGQQLEGILLLQKSDLQPDLNWEDRDLLKVAGRQAASHLVQHQASQALMESRQFEAFNRLSAYVIHDLKNILAQQSLIVSNATKHRSNPEFMDDVINTVENSVERMTRLMEQMRSGARGQLGKKLALNQLLRDSLANLQQTPPVPVLECCDDHLCVEADREQLLTVFGHIIQNAREATTKNGRVDIRISAQNQFAVVEIEDDGIGMEAEFVRDRLFKPFDSTKGLTGMGIGAFESREFVRKLGGNIEVTSSPGTGSLFRILLPSTTSPAESIETQREASID